MQVLFAIVCIYLWYFVPPPGVTVAIAATAAALMGLQQMSALRRFIWIVIVFALTGLEIRAILKDRHDQEIRQAAILSEERDRFAALIEQGQTNFTGTLTEMHNHFTETLVQEQNHFTATISKMIEGQQYTQDRFAKLLVEQQQLFHNQQEFAEFLTGHLLPASDPMPVHHCRNIEKDDVFVFHGTNVSLTNLFPHTILSIGGATVVAIDRTPSGGLFLKVDTRDKSKRVIMRLDQNGFRSVAGIHMLRPDKSTIVFEDAFGNEVLRARYLNSRAFSIAGIVAHGGG